MQLDLVDVFGSRAFAGNPLGVVHGAEGLDDNAMLRLTQWLGFSETTFLLLPESPEADYRVRIFYPAGELPFAGHPTLGSCHAWLRAGGRPRREGVIVQECGVGLVEDENLLAEYKLNIRNAHAKVLAGAIQKLLHDTSLSMENITGLAVSIGPGSFTGLRIGLSIAKGLAFWSGATNPEFVAGTKNFVNTNDVVPNCSIDYPDFSKYK